MKVNLGCGSRVPEGWINVDYALGARLSRMPVFRAINKKLRIFNLEWHDDIHIHDLTKEFPWESESADVVYSSHTLEHLSKEEGRQFLNQSYRILKKGGIIRIVVPDLRCIIERYLDGDIDADDFVKELGVLDKKRENYIKDKLSPFISFPHKCMYDTKTLVNLLNTTGFAAQSRKPFDSDIPDIRKVELERRTENAVIVEGVKK